LLVFETIYLCSDMKFLLDLDIGRLLCHRNGEWDDVNYQFSGHWSWCAFYPAKTKKSTVQTWVLGEIDSLAMIVACGNKRIS
jgi:hypothetical protein